MRVAVICMDTRGGIQPYVALSLGLRSAGHDVRIVAPSDFSAMLTQSGLPHVALSGSVEKALRESTGAAERGALASMWFVGTELKRRLAIWTRETLDGCEGVDVLTGGIGGVVVGLSVAEKLGKPFVETYVQPVGVPTDAYPGVLFSGSPRWLGRWGVRQGHRLSELGIWLPFNPAMDAARKHVLGLSGRPRASLGQPVLYGFSRHVVPMPATTGRPRHVVGYWTLPPAEGWTPPPALVAFLARSGPVVSIGFGSMASEDPGALTSLVAGAVRKAGVRAVLLAGWGGLDAVEGGDDLFCAEALPHEWLFPRVKAVVHHGGAGTTGAALRAGVPAIVVPFTMDQPFWGSRVHALGAGPAPIARKRLTQDRLAEALSQAVTDHAMTAQAAELGARIRQEDGVASAVEIFNRLS